MRDALRSVLACPACGGDLRPEGDSLRCLACGQAYPVKAGVPILLAGRRPPGEGPGDSDAMLHRRARWDRLRGGGSPSIRRYLAAIRSHLKPGALVLDVGTGPASMPRWLAESAPRGVGVIGLDVAPTFPVVASPNVRGLANVLLVRASSRRRLPFHDEVFDLVLRRLAPGLPGELARVLKPRGVLLQFTFGPEHWREVYDALPHLPRPSEESLRKQEQLLAEHFALEVHEHHGAEPATLDDVLALLESGPSARFVDRRRDLPVLRSLPTGPGGTLSLTVDERTYLGTKAARGRA